MREIIREYINTPGIGYEKVERILDAAHAIRYNIGRVIGRKEMTDEEIRKNRIEDYKKAIENKSILDMDMVIEEPILDKIPLEPYDDVVGFIIKYGKLEEWEKDILE